MKRILAVLLTVFLLLPIATVHVAALFDGASEPVSAWSAFSLRAGGGSSGGGGGGGGGGSSHSSHPRGNNKFSDNPIQTFLSFLAFLALSSTAAIVFRFKLSKYARNTKKLMKMLQIKDHAWKYKKIQKQVCATYFAVQEAWTQSDMKPAEQYMSDALYQSFQSKLSWMTYKHQRNVLKRVRLLEAIPVSLHDNEDDSLDHVWFYIKGSIIDYTIDTQTNEKIDGTSVPERFAEYWQFTREEGSRWVLNQILQEDESEQIDFCE